MNAQAPGSLWVEFPAHRCPPGARADAAPRRRTRRRRYRWHAGGRLDRRAALTHPGNEGADWTGGGSTRLRYPDPAEGEPADDQEREEAGTGGRPRRARGRCGRLLGNHLSGRRGSLPGSLPQCSLCPPSPIELSCPRDEPLRISSHQPRPHATSARLVRPLARRAARASLRIAGRGAKPPSRRESSTCRRSLYDHSPVWLIGLPEELSSHPTRSLLRGRQTSAHRGIPLTPNPFLQVYMRNDSHHRVGSSRT